MEAGNLGYQLSIGPSARQSGRFFRDLWPYVMSREVHKELGAPVYDSPDHVWIVARTATGELAAFGSWSTERLISSGLVLLDWMYVLEAHRRKGLYGMMFDERLRAAVKGGARSIRGATRAEHVRRVFVEHGFCVFSERGSWTYYQKEIAC